MRAAHNYNHRVRLFRPTRTASGNEVYSEKEPVRTLDVFLVWTAATLPAPGRQGLAHVREAHVELPKGTDLRQNDRIEVVGEGRFVVVSEPVRGPKVVARIRERANE